MIKQTPINRTIASMTLMMLLTAFSCKTAPQKEVKPAETTVITPQINENSPEVVEFTKAKEGFISDSMFQVAISSVLPNADERKTEAKSIAEQKALNLLKTHASPNLSEKGRKELREISKEGKLLDKNVSIGGRYFYLYQIQKRDLKQLVTSGLE